MVNIGFIWGVGLGLLFLLAIYVFIKKKVKREVKVINVKRPEEEGTEVESRANANSGIDATEPRTEERVDGEEPDGEPEERRGVQTKPVETVEPVKSGDKQHSSATQPPEPFIY